MLDAKVPVIVWVAPSGGYAASAGTFITLSANLAFMAPGTRIGAASPIDSSGQDIPDTLGKKVMNDTIAWVTSIAQVRHRPVDWAVSTVRDARSSAANEAVSLGAVDGIASTIDDVVAMAAGRTIQVGGQDVVLDLAGAPIQEAGINPLQGLLHLLADPNIALILFTIGFYGLLFEVGHPNLVTGILGALALILAFIGFKLLIEALHGSHVDHLGPFHLPEIGIAASLAFILVTLAVTTVASLVKTRLDARRAD
jgi:membrane-bound serine protease (ClpP class)